MGNSRPTRTGAGHVFTYLYDIYSTQLDKIRVGSTTIANYRYDSWRRLENTFKSSSALGVTFEYDLLGRLTEVAGLFPESGIDEDKITYAYNDALRQVTRTVHSGSGSTAETVAKDDLGRIHEVVNPLGTFTYTYTGVSPLIDAITHSGGFDVEFNWLGGECRQATQIVDFQEDWRDHGGQVRVHL